MNGCISTNSKVVLTAPSPQLAVQSGLRLHVRSDDENGSCIRERFGVSCTLILTLNSVGCEAHVMLG